MEQQNKRGRKKYEKEERKRIFDLANRAYACDPRIKAEIAREEAEKEAIKQAKKEAKAAIAKEREEKERKEQEEIQRKKDEEEAKKQREQEEAKQKKKLYRESVKQVIQICEDKMSGTKYDKFFAQEFVKKFAD